MKLMYRTFILCLLVMLALGAGTVFAADSGEFVFSSDNEVSGVSAGSQVKVKLKRLASGKYTWEITGSNIEQITLADEKIRQYLKAKGLKLKDK